MDDEAVGAVHHLTAPTLRLVHLAQAADFLFENVLGVPDGSKRILYLAADTTASNAVEAIIEELGIRKVIVTGHRASRVEYCLQKATASGRQALPPSARLVAEFQPPAEDGTGRNHRAFIFTVSAAWLAKAGTIATAFTKVDSTGAPQRPRVGTRQSEGWRPSSLFGFWPGGGADERTPHESSPTDPPAQVDGKGATASGGNSSRLSTLFNWSGAEESAASVNPARGRPISVVMPKDEAIEAEGSGAPDPEEQGKLEEEVEQMMVGRFAMSIT